nr:MAG TPA: tail assembly chaperone protein [Caudoviricetes sp.]
MESIQLKKDNILRIGIKTADGKDTGKILEFDLEDFELPLKLQDCLEQHKANIRDLRTKYLIIDKKQDKKGKKLMSSNQEEKIKTLKEFYNKEIEALDLFLGKGGTEKILNGRKPYLTMFDDINGYLEPIIPLIEKRAVKIEDMIKEKYSKKESDVLE